MYNIVMYYYVLIVFSLRRESLKWILATGPFRGGSVTVSDDDTTIICKKAQPDALGMHGGSKAVCAL
jgi:hypothetical protein